MRNIVVAYDSERAIGRNNELLWEIGDMRADMRRFRGLTENQAVIMGRKTLESMGRALPKRRNIVVSHQPSLEIPGIQVVGSLEEAYGLIGANEAFIIGGSQIYTQALPSIDRIFATEVDTTFEGADRFFPAINNAQWREMYREKFDQDENNKFNYDFVTYERK